MAEEATKAAKTEGKNEESPSMEEILQSIRGVISGEDEGGKSVSQADTETDNDDVLELTEMAEEETTETTTASEAAAGTQSVVAPVEEDVPAEAAIEELSAEPTTITEGVEEKSVLDSIDEVIAEEAGEPGTPDKEEATPEAHTATENITAADAGIREEDKEDTLEASPVIKKEKAADKPGRLINEPTAEKSTEALKSLVDSIPKVTLQSPGLRSGVTVEDLVIEALRPALAAWLNDNLATVVTQLVEKEIKRLIPQDDDD